MLSLIATLIALPALTALAASPDVAVDGGTATCARGAHKDNVGGSAPWNAPVLTAAGSGTVTVSIEGKRSGNPHGGACTFDVAITGADAVGLAALGPQAGVSDATSAPCAASG
ncbi:MAG TPA: hypothetical protein VHH36_07140, partial [Candidatus Thermoplasmatota archaeon]|nr:hypothetical protein [Candidatus Thermoplasmatota archaeon]